MQPDSEDGNRHETVVGAGRATGQSQAGALGSAIHGHFTASPEFTGTFLLVSLFAYGPWAPRSARAATGIQILKLT